MSADSATYWRTLFTQAVGVTRRWRAEQARSEGVISAAAEFSSRLRTLSRPASVPAPLLELPDAVTLLRAKHLRGLENIMAALRASVATFAKLHTELAELSAAAWSKHGGPGASSSATVVVVGAGRGLAEQQVLMPPPAQCLEWMGELDRLYCRELLLKTKLIEQLTHDAPAEHVQQTIYLWLLQPNLRAAPLERLNALAVSLTLTEPDEGDG